MKIKVLPAFNGDCLLISFEYQKEIKNILIDGGIARTYQRHLKPELQKLIDLGQKIDLLIVTHIDDDHIGGIKELYQDSGLDKEFIDEIWFNSGDLLSDYFNAPREKDRSVAIIKNDQTNMSVGQGVTLENALKEERGNWIQNLICVSESKIVFLGLSITVLSPNENKLKLLHKRWETETDKKTAMSKEHDDFTIPISDLINRKFQEDKAVPNGSSIALLIEKGETALLLLADTHPSVVVNSLIQKGLASKKNRLKLDIVKVSHHASKGNTSPELLSIIRCEKFIVSTDGSKHGLPDKEAIARIIAAHPGCKLYFNYENLAKEIFIPKDREDYQFDCNFLSTTDYTIEL